MLSYLLQFKNKFQWNKFFSYLFLCCFILFLVVCLIYNPKETLIEIGKVVAFIGGISLSIFIHDKLLEKNKINWEENKEIKKLTGWLCFVYCLFLWLIIKQVIEKELNNLFIEYGLSLIFSLWTYRSVILRKINATLLIRSYLLFMFFSLSYITIVNILSPDSMKLLYEEWQEKEYIKLGTYVFLYVIIPSLIIKGITIAFSKKWSELYANQKYLFKDILAITVIMIGIIYCYRNYFTFFNDQVNNKEITNNLIMPIDSVSFYNQYPELRLE